LPTHLTPTVCDRLRRIVDLRQPIAIARHSIAMTFTRGRLTVISFDVLVP
jgi:hypothetical protein